MARILITAGPTREPLDPVRFISNASSGRQGVALAEEALARGLRVDFVHGPLEVEAPPGAVSHPVTTAAEMLAACVRLHPACDFLIGAAAVSDYRPREISRGKHKRDGASWTIELVPTEDILATLARSKGNRVHAGFALETDDLVANALVKLRSKSLDWLVANSPSAIGAGSSRYVLLGVDGTRQDLAAASKREVAKLLLDRMLAGK
jgi:phosphopantothenoylcysteine decarboxylase/phosphopantothenate--cysteine ligase